MCAIIDCVCMFAVTRPIYMYSLGIDSMLWAQFVHMYTQTSQTYESGDFSKLARGWGEAWGGGGGVSQQVCLGAITMRVQ